MADTKVSQLTPTSTLNTGDYMLLVQSGNSVKLNIQALFKNIPVYPIILEAAETPNSGVIDINIFTSKIASHTTANNYTLASGTHGMEKYIVCSTADSTTPQAMINVTGGTGFTTIGFTTIGGSVHLKNISGSWYVTGNYNVSIV